MPIEASQAYNLLSQIDGKATPMFAHLMGRQLIGVTGNSSGEILRCVLGLVQPGIVRPLSAVQSDVHHN